MMISAEEEVQSVEEAATGNRQSKQIYLVPQLSPESTYPESYLEGSPYELPLMRPKLRRFPVRKQQLAASNWPYTHHPLLSSPGIISIDLSMPIKNNSSLSMNNDQFFYKTSLAQL